MNLSTLEKNKLDNIDLLQIEYLSDLPVSKTDVIVVESSNPVAITIRKFLTRLGFENIHICQGLDDGVKIFSDFLNKEINVPFIIDDSVSDKNLKNSVKEIFELQPSANIIITTAKEKTDIQLIDLFNLGVVSIIHKPINFDDFKKSLLCISNEKNNTQETSLDERLRILFLSYNKISLKKIQDYLGVSLSEAESVIQKPIENRILIQDQEILEATCNQCGSSNLSCISECPQCKGVNFRQLNLIEHYRCGEVYPKESNYTVCPKCNKEIGSVGRDYREFPDYHVCSHCNDKFPKPLTKFACLMCGNFFIEKLTMWKKTKLYRIQK